MQENRNPSFQWKCINIATTGIARTDRIQEK